MHILIGLGAAVALLYFWLLGHWFARVLAFLLLAVVMGFGGAQISTQMAASPHPTVATIEPRASTYEEFIAAGESPSDAEFLAHTGAALPSSAPLSDQGLPIFAVLGCVLGVVVAWPLSSIPIYYQRYQLTGGIARPRRGA